MEIQPIGSGAVSIDALSRKLPPVGQVSATGAGRAGDSLTPFLELLSSPQVRDLLSDSDLVRPDVTAMRALLKTAEAALAAGDIERALTAISEYVAQNPEQAAELVKNPALASVQGAVREIILKHSQEAKASAERAMGAASELVAAAGRAPGNLDGRAVLSLAAQMMETGQLVNYVRAEELSQAVMNMYVMAFPELRIQVPHDPFHEGAESSGLGGGLLWMMAAWLAVGMAGLAALWLPGPFGLEILVAQSASTLGTIWGLGMVLLLMVQIAVVVRKAVSQG